MLQTSSANHDLNLMFYGLIGFLIIIFVFSALAKLLDRRNEKHLHRLQQEESRLETLINARKEMLTRLDNEIESKTIDHEYRLNKTAMEVLNMYEYCRIQIPVEIIEELAHLHLADKEQTITYIENQRKMWKLENSKILIRMDVFA